MPIGLLEGSMVSIFLTIAAVAIIAKLIDDEKMLSEHLGYGVMVTLLTASAVGAIVSIRRIKRRVLLVAMLFGLLYIFILMTITALLFGGQYEAVGVTVSLILGGSLAAGFLEIGRGERKNNQKKRLRRF